MSQLHPFITNELSKSDMIANYEKQRSELITTHKQVLYPSSVYPIYFHPMVYKFNIYISCFTDGSTVRGCPTSKEILYREN